MPGNVVGQAWVEIRPDLSGFSAELTAGLTDAIAKAQAYVDTRPLQFRAQVDTAQAVAAVMAAGTAMQAAATANPITFDASIDMAKALAQLALLRAAAASAGGGDGGGVVPVPLPGRSGGGGQSGGSTVGYLAAAGGAALLLGTLTKILGVGAGMTTLFGVTMPAAFSVLSLAGLGFEHVMATILGLAASLAGAIGGGLLLALGAVGVAAVGMGSDLAVMKSTIADTQTLYKALETLRQAVIQYGAGSAQAAAAQTALNVQIQMLGNTAGVAAELALAKSVQALNIYWDQATSGARVAAVGILQQFLTVAQQYIPLVASAATRNFGIIQQAIQPLMAYLAGPAKQIFQNLENVFAQNLPASIHALSMGIELVLKTINFLSQYVGGATQAIDKLLTSANSSTGFIKWEGIMQTLIGLFHTWWDFFSILGKDMIDVFSLTAGLGQSIIQDLTTMLTRLHDWLNLTTTQTTLHNLFEIHKQEVQDLLALLPGLFSALGSVYLHLAPALTTALATVLQALVPILTAITSNAWGAWVVGLGLILAKFGALVPVIKIFSGGIGSLVGLFSGAGAAATTAATAVEGGMAAAGTSVGGLVGAINPVTAALLGIGVVVAALVLTAPWQSLHDKFLNDLQTPGTQAYNQLHSDNLAAIADLENYASAKGWKDIAATANTTFHDVWNAHVQMIQQMEQGSSAFEVFEASQIGTLSQKQQQALRDYLLSYTIATGQERDQAAQLAKDFTADQIKEQVAAGLVPPAIGQIALALLQVPGALATQQKAWSTWSVLTGADISTVQNMITTASADMNGFNGIIQNGIGLVQQFGNYLSSPALQQALQNYKTQVANLPPIPTLPSGGSGGGGGGPSIPAPPAPSAPSGALGGGRGPAGSGSSGLGGNPYGFSMGGFANFPDAGQWAVLHGREYVVPEDKATPALQAMMSAAIRGGRGAFPPLTPPSLPPSLVSGGGGIHMPPVNITQGDINLHGLTPPEILPAIERAVQRNNRELVAALRAR